MGVKIDIWWVNIGDDIYIWGVNIGNDITILGLKIDIWWVNIGGDIEEDTEGDINLWTDRELESRVFLPEKYINHFLLHFDNGHNGNNDDDDGEEEDNDDKDTDNDDGDDYDDDDDLSGGGDEADCVEARSSSWYQGSRSVTFDDFHVHDGHSALQRSKI